MLHVVGGIQVLVPLATKADEARKVRETAFPDGIHTYKRDGPLAVAAQLVFSRARGEPRGRG